MSAATGNYVSVHKHPALPATLTVAACQSQLRTTRPSRNVVPGYESADNAF
jgi:hypothetical protein